LSHPPDRPSADGAEAHVAFDRVVVELAERRVIGGLSCAFPACRISVILGGSGMGKTTLLRAIGGLVPVASGSVRVLGREITRLSERAMYAVRDDLGMMFQNGALLDSLSVFDNLALPLREHGGMEEARIADEVHACLESVGLKGVDELLPRQLSGGMVKRTALARAILMKPRVLLCDEPFSGLDPVSARRIEQLLTRINRERCLTVIAVSHDVTSTLRMADHVVLLLPGGAFEGSPGELQASEDPRVAGFLAADREMPPEEDLPEVEVAADGRGAGAGA